MLELIHAANPEAFRIGAAFLVDLVFAISKNRVFVHDSFESGSCIFFALVCLKKRSFLPAELHEKIDSLFLAHFLHLLQMVFLAVFDVSNSLLLCFPAADALLAHAFPCKNLVILIVDDNMARIDIRSVTAHNLVLFFPVPELPHAVH